MIRTLSLWSLAAVVALGVGSVGRAGDVYGTYLESRTCQVYTGPCFANSEMAIAGKEAIMAWKIDGGEQDGVDLGGLKVVLVLKADATLGHQGIDDAKELKSVVLVDERANAAQRDALLKFACQRAGKAGAAVVRVDSSPISMELDLTELKGELVAGREVKLETRKAKPGDCICSNEVAYYPPLSRLQNFAPGVSTEAEFKGRGLGTQWSRADSRSAYMGLFTE